MEKIILRHKTLIIILLISLSGALLLGRWAMAEDNLQNASWESMGPEGGWISNVLQHPTDNNILYATSYEYPCRIYKSTDKGNTWIQLFQIDGFIDGLTIDPNNPSKMYGFNGTVVHKSTDGGSTWTYDRIENHFFYGGMVDPNDSNLIHAYGEYYTGTEWKICYFKSTNGGSSWSRQIVPLTSDYILVECMKYDPTNSAVVYIGGYYYTGTDYEGFIYRSTDGGTSWTDVSSGTEGFVWNFVVDPTSGKVYVITSYGIYRSTNLGNTWALHNGWAGGRVLAIDPNNPQNLFAGDYNRCFKSTDGGVNWTMCITGLFGGYCNSIIVDGENSNNVFYATGAGFFKSTDGGVTWFPSNSGLLLANITALKLVPAAPTTMYIAFDNNAVYKTNNARGKPNGPSAVIWDRLPEFYACHNIAAFAIPHANPDHVYAMEGGG